MDLLFILLKNLLIDDLKTTYTVLKKNILMPNDKEKHFNKIIIKHIIDYMNIGGNKPLKQF